MISQADYDRMFGNQPTTNLADGLGNAPQPGLEALYNPSGSQGAQTVGGGAPQGNPMDSNPWMSGNITNSFDPNAGVIDSLPTLGAGAFAKTDAGFAFNGNDPFINKMINTAGMGAFAGGLDAFTAAKGSSGTNFYQHMGGSLIPGQQQYSTETWKALASKFGVDMNDPDYQNKIRTAADNYVVLTGMGSQNPNDARQMDQIMYKKQDDGSWAPVGDTNWSQREKGSWLAEHKGVMLPLAVLGIGAAAGALGGGAAAAGGSGASSAAGAGAGVGGGITGTGGASGLAAYGAGSGAAGAIPGGFSLGSTAGGITGAAGAGGAGSAASGLAGLFAPGGTSGLTGSLANAIGMGSQWGAIPAVGQGAITGAAQGALTSGLSGGDIWKGMLTGALGGGLAPVSSAAVGATGLTGIPAAAASGALTGAGNALIGGGNPLTGALMGGLGGGVGSSTHALTGNGTLAQVASRLATTGAGSALQNAIRDEVFQGRSDIMSGIYQQAAQRGIPQQQLEAFLQTPQGRQAAQRFIQSQGSAGTLQSMFG